MFEWHMIMTYMYKNLLPTLKTGLPNDIKQMKTSFLWEGKEYMSYPQETFDKYSLRSHTIVIDLDI